MAFSSSLAIVRMVIIHAGMDKKNNLISFIKAMYHLDKINTFYIKTCLQRPPLWSGL